MHLMREQRQVDARAVEPRHDGDCKHRRLLVVGSVGVGALRYEGKHPCTQLPPRLRGGSVRIAIE